jgi:hypothetical protein
MKRHFKGGYGVQSVGVSRVNVGVPPETSETELRGLV